METRPEKPRSFADTALAGEDSRRRAEPFPRPARAKFRRHAIVFLVVNVLLAAANLVLLPEHVFFYYVTIVWAFVLGDNFLWAYVVDPDRDVAERTALREERERRRTASHADHADTAPPGGMRVTRDEESRS